jgi:hypothetical protein
MGNFEVSVAYQPQDFQSYFQIVDDVSHKTVIILKNKARMIYFIFVETIIRKQFHNLVV